MSYSHKVKEELYRHIDEARHCRLSELSALLRFSGQLKLPLRIESDNRMFAIKCFTLLQKTFNIQRYAAEREGFPCETPFRLEVSDPAENERIFSALSNELLLQRGCCRRAYLRGAFLAAGSVNDPQKSYHFEIVAQEAEEAELLCKLFQSFSIEARITKRKNSEVVYIKDGESIVDSLNVMQAPVALMAFENVRILKDMKNNVNRRVNFEAANIGKTVSAAVRQRKSIELAKKLPEFEELPESVKEAARLRLEFPDLSLKELGEMCEPKVGKSGFNHRLRRIIELVEDEL